MALLLFVGIIFNTRHIVLNDLSSMGLFVLLVYLLSLSKEQVSEESFKDLFSTSFLKTNSLLLCTSSFHLKKQLFLRERMLDFVISYVLSAVPPLPLFYQIFIHALGLLNWENRSCNPHGLKISQFLIESCLVFRSWSQVSFHSNDF